MTLRPVDDYMRMSPGFRLTKGFWFVGTPIVDAMGLPPPHKHYYPPPPRSPGDGRGQVNELCDDCRQRRQFHVTRDGHVEEVDHSCDPRRVEKQRLRLVAEEALLATGKLAEEERQREAAKRHRTAVQDSWNRRKSQQRVSQAITTTIEPKPLFIGHTQAFLESQPGKSPAMSYREEHLRKVDHCEKQVIHLQERVIEVGKLYVRATRAGLHDDGDKLYAKFLRLNEKLRIWQVRLEEIRTRT